MLAAAELEPVMQAPAGPVRCRPAVGADQGLILDSWVNSYRKSRDVRDVIGPVYRSGQRQLAERLLERCGATVLCASDFLPQVFAWMCAEKVGSILVLHYLYVKQPYRRQGLARTLLFTATMPELPAVHHTHRTDAGAGIIRWMRSTWNPYLAR